MCKKNEIQFSSIHEGLGYSPADLMEEIFNDEDETVNWSGDIWEE